MKQSDLHFKRFLLLNSAAVPSLSRYPRGSESPMVQGEEWTDER